MFDPNVLPVYYKLERGGDTLTLIAGDHWLKYDGSSWTVDADEPATQAEVAALLNKAGGVTTWWGP